ncbi:L-serine ammonia-lyase [Micropruina sonneratiae]|uniref:L-serine ammonia-lyase n=1 Tax=Micropruina sonneratiae TaxID=2986940 RepID=UPI002227A828|nr:L-serine ammonia-lyase [Micropruina sp. KQZ13P-5]MCW3158971.1 L-serine ammonia-lyase [Micropruina sp. KQZ13P-5]
MALSFFDLFSIGIGPSSSHTVGPMRAALRVAEDLAAEDRLDEVTRVRVDLYGSLGSTGRGHHSDRAVLLGLLGERPETIDPAGVEPALRVVRRTGRLPLLGRHEIDFDPDADIVLHRRRALPQHPNGMRVRSFGAGGVLIDERVMFSIGGGFVATADELDAPPPPARDTEPYPFTTASRLLALCAEHGLSIEQVVLGNECALRPEADVRAGVLATWRVMAECVRNGFATNGRLPGGLNVLRRAPQLHRHLSENPPDDLTGMDWIAAYALAVNEENAAGGRVVTAPTNGAAGVIPAVLHYYRHHMPGADDDGVVTFLLTATAVGAIIKTTASISGAEVGCQGEVGSACAMAAAGLAAVMGGTPAQVENAAEIGMEHNLGLTCDPVGGLVQVPCIERNAIAAVKAVAAARTAMHFDGTHLVPLDTVVATMRDTGADMLTKYKETSKGGLAVNVVEC